MSIPGLLEELTENFDELAPITFSYWNSNKPQVINDFIKSTYLRDYSDISKMTRDTYMNVTDVCLFWNLFKSNNFYNNFEVNYFKISGLF